MRMGGGSVRSVSGPTVEGDKHTSLVPDGINVSSSCAFLVVCWEMLVKTEYSTDATEYGL